MNEVWRDIPGYEGSHQISNWGRVRSLDRIVPNGKGAMRIQRGSILRPWLSRNGYLRVDICKDSKNHKHGIHCLVAAAFLGVRPEKYDVHHINGEQLDNRAENLEYKSRIDHIGGENHPSAKLTNEQVRRTKELLKEGSMTQVEIGKQLGINPIYISHIKNGTVWAHIKV